MTRAHSQEISLKLLERWPDHKPRKSDPNFRYFRAAKKRLKAAGLLKCVVDSEIHAGQIELHHDKVEYAHINDIDIKKFNRLWGLSLTDRGFVRFVEEEGNLEPLCTLHHRGIFGVHSLPAPEWNVLRTSKQDHEIIRVLSNKGGVFVSNAGPVLE